MKKYTKMAHITDSYSEEFLQKVSNRINEFQELGLEVEVQYQSVAMSFTAIVLGYMEK